MDRFLAEISSTPPTYARVGALVGYEELLEFVPGLRDAHTFSSWSDFRAAMAEIKGPVVVFGPPEGTDALKSLYPPRPGVGIVLVGSKNELEKAEGAGADLLLSHPFEPVLLSSVKVLTKRIQFEAGVSEASKAGRGALEALAHDLGAPTTAIVAYAEILMTQAEGEARDDLRHIVENAKVIEDLAGRLLGLTRSGERGVPLRPKVVPPAVLLEESVSVLAPICEEKGISVKISDAAELPPLWVDPVAIRRVFCNILDNAIRVSPRDSKIEINADRTGDAVRFRFSDQGPGLSPELLSRIFLRYESGGGRTGLGLAIAWELVTLHGGVIWAENRETEGAAIVVVLPTILKDFTLFETHSGTILARPGTKTMTITFKGSFGREDTAPVRTALLAAVEEAPAVVVDLAACTDLASGIIAVLYELSLESENRMCPFSVAEVSPELEPILNAARLPRCSSEASLPQGGPR